MNLLHAYIPPYANQNSSIQNGSVQNYNSNSNLNLNSNSNSGSNVYVNSFPIPNMNANMFLGHNNTTVSVYNNSPIRPQFAIDPKIYSKDFNQSNFNNLPIKYEDTSNYNRYNNIGNNYLKGQDEYLYKSYLDSKMISLQYNKSNNKNINKNVTHEIYRDNCKRVIIFDLDDTLIPTCWIRDRLTAKYNLSYEQSLKEIKKEIQTNKNYNFESTVCSVIHLAKSISSGVFIVTNARSDKWIETVRWLFPQFSKVLDEYNIPIIRTDQQMEVYPLKLYEHFRFWMNAKKKKFYEIIMSHRNLCNRYAPGKIDFISLGDTEFEEVATRELQMSNKNIINKAFNIKVQAGLPLGEFIGQLKLIQVGLSIIIKESYSYKYLALSGSVQIKLFY
ncbi:conserved Plasmodium protein, unknown function [Plasmodium vinckei vinckei]|uniref:Uncharacterized protein n=1 Tax=Plasmodium vinckei vinckei TaxID=54757 RepID=A0A449BQV3_PLAVN|nr:conserved Plasmodium protein, unknown function [Plasmodium vinckei vinckei]VEV55831.1 conserved Plasmodium protein, unknown function [Plasmodium vinckei vinckei]